MLGVSAWKWLLGPVIGAGISVIFLTIWPNTQNKIGLVVAYIIMGVPAFIKDTIFAGLSDLISLRIFVAGYCFIVGLAIALVMARNPKGGGVLLVGLVLVHIALGLYIYREPILS
jgi:hypothetical protein